MGLKSKFRITKSIVRGAIKGAKVGVKREVEDRIWKELGSRYKQDNSISAKVGRFFLSVLGKIPGVRKLITFPLKAFLPYP